MILKHGVSQGENVNSYFYYQGIVKLLVTSLTYLPIGLAFLPDTATVHNKTDNKQEGYKWGPRDIQRI